jgi:hypothetical protein
MFPPDAPLFFEQGVIEISGAASCAPTARTDVSVSIVGEELAPPENTAKKQV